MKELRVEVAIYNHRGTRLKYQGFIYENLTSAWADFEALTDVFDRFISYRKNLDKLDSEIDPKGEPGGRE